MTEKILSNVCKEHSGLETQIKSAQSTFKWTLGIFLIVSMAVVAFFWHGQAAIIKVVTETRDKVLVIESDMKHHLGNHTEIEKSGQH